MIKVVCLAAILTLAPVVTWACIPLPVGTEKNSSSEIAKGILQSSGKNFVGKVETVKVEPLQKNRYHLITFKVLKQYVGVPVNEITVSMNGNNCKTYEPVIGKVDIIWPVIFPGQDLPLYYHAQPDYITYEELEMALDKHTGTESPK